MTRKDYQLIAKALADAEPLEQERAGLAGQEFARVATDAWRSTLLSVADALADDSGYDLNGNRRFDRDRFLAAAGMPAKVVR